MRTEQREPNYTDRYEAGANYKPDTAFHYGCEQIFCPHIQLDTKLNNFYRSAEKQYPVFTVIAVSVVETCTGVACYVTYQFKYHIEK